MDIHRFDYEKADGKWVRVRKEEIYGWAAVNTITGEVELEEFKKYDDELCTLAPPWEWRRFTLTLFEKQ